MWLMRSDDAVDQRAQSGVRDRLMLEVLERTRPS